jgi:DNA-binding CsgD family transcriptional regulator
VAAASWEAVGPSLPPGTQRSAFVDVRDEVGSAALCFIVERSGRDRASHADGGTWVVADRLDRRRPIDVLVCGSTPVDAQEAVAAFGRGEVRAVICREQPRQLVAALDALDAGLCLVPVGLVEQARDAPALTERQRDVLRAVMAGQSNPEIAHALGLRPVTVKREVSTLFALLGACRRMDLIGRAYDLGYRKRPLRP